MRIKIMHRGDKRSPFKFPYTLPDTCNRIFASYYETWKLEVNTSKTKIRDLHDAITLLNTFFVNLDI